MAVCADNYQLSNLPDFLYNYGKTKRSTEEPYHRSGRLSLTGKRFRFGAGGTTMIREVRREELSACAELIRKSAGVAYRLAA